MEKTYSHNLSARPAKVTLNVGGADLVIDDFPGDYDPVTIDELTFRDAMFDVNGKMFKKTKFAAIRLRIATIPGSQGEVFLTDAFREDLKGEDVVVEYGLIELGAKDGQPVVQTSKLVGGVFLGASIGYSATQEGRIQTKFFTFAFASEGG